MSPGPRRAVLVVVLGLPVAAAGCRSSATPCATLGAPSPLVAAAAGVRLDVYGGGVACDGRHAAAGARPSLSRTFARGAPVAVDVGAGAHTIVLTTLDPSGAETGSACASGTWSGGSTVCVDLLVSPDDGGAPDAANAAADAAPDGGCRSAADCARAPTCQANQALSWPPSGTSCAMGACVYPPPFVTNCPQGCYQGSCTGGLATLSPAQAFAASTGAPVPLAEVSGSGTGGGVAPSTSGVEVRVQLAPRGTGRALTLRYALDGSFTAPTALPMAFVGYTGSDEETWSATIPAQAAGAHVYFFVEADGWDNTKLFVPGNQQNYLYQCQ